MRIMLERGFYNDCTGAESLDEKLKATSVSGYIGFDATAKSLHVGSLTQIMMLYWLQECGHNPIVLMGGGTTKIGDPSFRNEERALLSEEKINENIGTIKKAFSNYINFDHGDNRAIILDN